MKIQNDTGVTYAANTNRYSNTQNAGSKTGRTYKNAHEYKNYLTQKYDCLRSKDYSVNINSSLLSEVMGDEKTKQWLEYNLSLIPKTIEQSEAYVAARGAKILSYSITIKQEQEERQYNLRIDGKDVADLTGKLVELLGTSTSIGVMESGTSSFDALA